MMTDSLAKAYGKGTETVLEAGERAKKVGFTH